MLRECHQECDPQGSPGRFVWRRASLPAPRDFGLANRTESRRIAPGKLARFTISMNAMIRRPVATSNRGESPGWASRLIVQEASVGKADFWHSSLSDRVMLVKTTRYFALMRSRSDRAWIDVGWIERVVQHPAVERVQADGRIRRWAPIQEAGNRVPRVVLLEDGETVHNAFFDRTFRA